ncbi:hypothetical protein STAFG_0897 [Streptomyces afghaniensis 772]|uniref:Zinc-finger domain-containing protein n=1 Tax=Streptomyces afghaniensis 772 TaxID=1283301 RepID=S4MR44_9ACTN|nr:hypothetical protein STAFG_0897 [Streptomyces afghaniensis 772]
MPEEDLRAYARGELAAPALWSADAHLGACAACRGVLAEVSDPVALDAGWERLDAELDAPRVGSWSRCWSGPGWPGTPRGCWRRRRCCGGRGWGPSSSCCC